MSSWKEYFAHCAPPGGEWKKTEVIRVSFADMKVIMRKGKRL